MRPLGGPQGQPFLAQLREGLGLQVSGVGFKLQRRQALIGQTPRCSANSPPELAGLAATTAQKMILNYLTTTARKPLDEGPSGGSLFWCGRQHLGRGPSRAKDRQARDTLS